MPGTTRLGRYELLARIATGGMGEIFLARLAGAAGFEKLCVIKRILPHLADDTRFRAMLIAEARIAASLSHANICHVYELDEMERQLYLVMEYLHGVTLLQLLRATCVRGEQLDLGFIAGVVQQTCEGLHYAHELRDRSGTPLAVVHRDVTPSNLFVTDSGVVKIVDFGIAKADGHDESSGGIVKGKYAYMAPEQLRGATVDRRADVFSLAVVIYELVTCRRLYQRKTDYLTLRAVLAPPKLALAMRRPDAPAALQAVLERALAADVHARIPTARQLAAEVLAALGAPRPWSQSEIAEHVHAMFADHLRRTDDEIARVVARPGTSGAMPVILERVPGVIAGRREVSDVSGVSEAGEVSQVIEISESSEVRDVRAASENSENSDVRRVSAADRLGEVSHVSEVTGVSGLRRAGAISSVGGAPSVAAGSEVGSVDGARGAAAARPGRSTAPPRTPPASPSRDPRAGRRAIAAAIGSAAFVLAVGLAALAALAPTRAPVPDAPTAHTSAAGAAEAPYAAAIRERERELAQCARAYAGALPPEARAVVLVGRDGRPREVAVSPAAPAASPIGGCLREVLERVEFPASADDREVAVGLALAP